MIINKQFLQIFFIINLIPTTYAYDVQVLYEANYAQFVYVQEENVGAMYSVMLHRIASSELGYIDNYTFKNLKNNTTYKLFTPTCKNEVKFKLDTVNTAPIRKFYANYFTNNFSQAANPHTDYQAGETLGDNVIKFQINDTYNTNISRFQCTIRLI